MHFNVCKAYDTIQFMFRMDKNMWRLFSDPQPQLSSECDLQDGREPPRGPRVGRDLRRVHQGGLHQAVQEGPRLCRSWTPPGKKIW